MEPGFGAGPSADHEEPCQGQHRLSEAREVIVFKGWLLSAERWAEEAAARAAEGVTAAVVPIAMEAEREAVARALAVARGAGLEPYLWIEVARDEAAARAHPEWLSEPQHTEWLELFPEQDWSGRHAVVYPWICVNNRAVFEYARDRVCRLVNAIDAPLAGVFLNDRKGAWRVRKSGRRGRRRRGPRVPRSRARPQPHRQVTPVSPVPSDYLSVLSLRSSGRGRREREISRKREPFERKREADDRGSSG
jgi:hypothetical protein